MPAQTATRAPIPPPLRHRLLLGDWGRLVRDPIDLLRTTYLGGTVYFAAAGDVGGAARLGATAVFVYLARWIAVPRPFDLGFVLAMGLQGWGNVFDLFERLAWWDVVVHFALSMWVAPLFYIGLARLGALPDLGDRTLRHSLAGIFLITLALGLAFGAGYEIYEWIVDHWIGGQLEISYPDTIADLAMDAAGAGAGGLMLLVWGTYGWGTTRRVPGERLSA